MRKLDCYTEHNFSEMGVVRTVELEWDTHTHTQIETGRGERKRERSTLYIRQSNHHPHIENNQTFSFQIQYYSTT